MRMLIGYTYTANWNKVDFYDNRNWVPLAFILAVLAGWIAAKLLDIVGGLAGKTWDESNRYLRNFVSGLSGGFLGGAIWEWIMGQAFPGIWDNFFSIIIGGFLVNLIAGATELIINKIKSKESDINNY